MIVPAGVDRTVMLTRCESEGMTEFGEEALIEMLPWQQKVRQGGSKAV